MIVGPLMGAEAGMPQLKGTQYLRGLLGKTGIYWRMKASWIYDFYWRLVDSRITDHRQREVDFYRRLLDGFHQQDLVFDIGANQGYKSDIFLRFGASVVAVEPDETSQEVLKQRFLKYRLKKKPFTVVSKAVSDKSGADTIWIDTPGGAKNTLSEKWVDTLRKDDHRFGQKLSFGQRKEIQTISIEQLIVDYGLPFFIKIDVEGHELKVLRGMQKPVPFLSFEVNLPEFRREGLECIQVLGRLDRDGRFNYANDCRQGLALNSWLTKEEFSAVLDACTYESIEVFWKTAIRHRS